jgi:phosphatidylglycerol---prolipoprotein diacylglyceryl transferase
MFPRLFTIPEFELLGRHIGPLSVPSYGLILFIAFVVALWVLARQAERQKMDPAVMTDLGIYSLLGGLVGAKLLLIVVDFREYIHQPSELKSILFSGGVFYGGLIGGILTAIWYVRRQKLPLWRAMDVMAPAVVMGQVVGRLACLAAGCCFGRETHVPWAIVYHDMYAARQIPELPIDTPVHPSPLYESIAAGLIFAVLLWMVPRKRFHGQLALTYAVLYSAARFVLEYFRGDKVRGIWFGGALSTSQIISIGLILLALAVMPYLLKHNRASAPAT